MTAQVQPGTVADLGEARWEDLSQRPGGNGEKGEGGQPSHLVMVSWVSLLHLPHSSQSVLSEVLSSIVPSHHPEACRVLIHSAHRFFPGPLLTWTVVHSLHFLAHKGDSNVRISGTFKALGAGGLALAVGLA